MGADRHPLPVHSSAPPPQPPPAPAPKEREPTTEVRPLTAQRPRIPVSGPSASAQAQQQHQSRPSPAQAGRLVTSASSFLTKKKKRKANKSRNNSSKNKDADLEVGAVEGGGTGRVIVPSGHGGASAAAAAAGTYKQPRVKVRVKGASSGRMALPSQSASFRKGGAGASSSTAAAPLPRATPDDYRPVQTPDGSLAFTRPRGTELDRSIAAVLHKRPAEILDEYEKESRTKRQKTAAEEFKRMMLAEDEEEEKGNESDEESLAGGVGAVKKDEDDWVEDDADDDLVVQPTAQPTTTLMQQPDAKPALDLFAAAHPAPLFPPIKPFVFPAKATGTSTQSLAVPSIQPVVVTQQQSEAETRPVMTEGQKVEEPTLPLKAVEPDQPPTQTELAPMQDEDVHVAAGPASTADAPIAPLPRALPLPSSKTLPSPALRSAALLLATKRRKPSTKARKARLRRAPQLFDYLSDQESEDWEDVEVSREKEWARRRPKCGRAVDGRMDVVKDEEGERKVDEEVEKVKVDRDILPSARANAHRQLVPTSYQTALLERAKQGNLITVLGTGSGKTLVAVRSFLSLARSGVRFSTN